MVLTLQEKRARKASYMRKLRARDPEIIRREHRRLRKAKREWFNEYRATLTCSRCPENHPACLDFHHTDPSTKKFGISEGVSWCFSIRQLKIEIAKCVVLCSNCHRKLHYSELKTS